MRPRNSQSFMIMSRRAGRVHPVVATLLVILLLAGVVVASGVLAFMGFGGITPRQCVRSVRTSYNFLAVRQCIWFGDRVLPYLKIEFQNYEGLAGFPSKDVAVILGSIKSEAALSVLRELYSRTQTWPKLIGATGLIIQGQFTDPIDEKSFLIQCLSSSDTVEMATIGLGMSGRKEAVPYLVNALLNPRYRNYTVYSTLADALANLGDPRAIPALKQCMQRADCFTPEAFQALIVLGEREAVPLGIARISPEIRGLNSGFIVDALSDATGQKYGFDRPGWEHWWQVNKNAWQIPERARKRFKPGSRLLELAT